MSLIELVMAAMILLLAITAVFGLIITSTKMTLFAKQQNTATNVANSYIEYVRSIPFDQVGVVGGANGSIAGTLAAETTVAIEGMNMTIIPTVTGNGVPSGDSLANRWKVLTIVVRSVVGNTGRELTARYTTNIRPGDVNAGTALVGPPSIIFITGQNPPAGGAVYSPPDVRIAVRARSSKSTIYLRRVWIEINNVPVHGSLAMPPTGLVTPGVADWSGIGSAGPVDFSILWDTSAMSTDTPSVPLSPDGMRTITAHVEDDGGGAAIRQIAVIVDNYAPSAVTSISGGSATSVDARSEWAEASDGTDPARDYSVKIEVQGDTGPDVWSPIAGMPSTSGGANYFDHAATPFSRYRATISALSARGLPGPASEGDAYISRSNLSGSATSMYVRLLTFKWRTGVTLVLDPPTFSYSDILNEVYEAPSPTGPWTLVTSGPGFTFYPPAFLNDPPDPANHWKVDRIKVKYYQVRSVVTPTGWPSVAPAANAPAEVWSGIVRNRQIEFSSPLLFVQW